MYEMLDSLLVQPLYDTSMIFYLLHNLSSQVSILPKRHQLRNVFLIENLNVDSFV